MYLVEDGKAAFRAVKTGLLGELDVEVQEGLEGGETLITGPFKALRSLKPGDAVYTKKRPDLRATILNAKLVEYEGKQWRYNDWGTHVTGWSAINIYQQVVLDRTGQALDDLRKQLRQGLMHR